MSESENIIPEDKLHEWFGLSYATFLTLPRAFMQEMPLEWRNKMAELLYEYNDVFCNQPDFSTRVQITSHGKTIKTPSWIVDYRHPETSVIKTFMKRGGE